MRGHGPQLAAADSSGTGRACPLLSPCAAVPLRWDPPADRQDCRSPAIRRGARQRTGLPAFDFPWRRLRRRRWRGPLSGHRLSGAETPAYISQCHGPGQPIFHTPQRQILRRKRRTTLRFRLNAPEPFASGRLLPCGQSIPLTRCSFHILIYWSFCWAVTFLVKTQANRQKHVCWRIIQLGLIILRKNCG